jgi:hypothetical protein
MRTVLAIWLALAGVAFAGESADRTAVTNLVSTLNNRDLAAQERSALFLDGATIETLPAPLVDYRGVWPEATRPFVVTDSMQFLGTTLVLVKAAVRQFGSFGSIGTPLQIVAMKVGDQWRIACLSTSLITARD